MMPSFLSVPQRNPRGRRSSEGCLAMNPDDLKRVKKLAREKEKQSSIDSDEMKPIPERKATALGAKLTDMNLLEVLRNNYDIVSALADIDHVDQDNDSLNEQSLNSKQMKGPIPTISTGNGSPKPLILRNHNPYKYNNEFESTSISSSDSISIGESEAPTITSRIKCEVREFLLDIVDALDAPADSPTSPQTENNSKLSAVALKKDIKRCYNAVHPFIEVAAALYDILLWKNPVSTLLLTLVYMYAVFRGWLATLALLLLLLQLSLNYLYSRKNIDMGLSFLPRKEVAMPRFDMNGAQLIFDIAKRAQHALRFGADFMEKLSSLLTWRDERVTRVFYSLVIYWLAWATLFNTGTCIGWCAATLGIRIFMTTYLFNRFPRLRKRLDTWGWFYRNLPTKSSPAQLPQSQPVSTPCTIRDSLPPNIREERMSVMDVPPYAGGRRYSSAMIGETFESKMGSNFTASREQLFKGMHASTQNLSLSDDEDDMSLEEEDPMIDNVIAYRSCVMNEKEKSFPKGITPGVLYLTDAALIFRSRYQSQQKEERLVLFHDIRYVKKVQSLRTVGLIAGTRKSLEIAVDTLRKPVQFIGVAKRDEFIDRLQQACKLAQASCTFE